MTTITRAEILATGPCVEAIAWGEKKYNGKECIEKVQLIKDLMADNQHLWANWMITKMMVRPQYLAYAIFAAEQVLGIWEEKHPEDNRPRKAIEVAKVVLKDDSTENRAAAYAAANAADAAANVADAAYAAYAAAYVAAYAAANAADAAANVADAAYAAYAAYAAADARKNMRTKILVYGLKLMRKKP